MYVPFHSRTTEVRGGVKAPCSQRLHWSAPAETGQLTCQSSPSLTAKHAFPRKDASWHNKPRLLQQPQPSHPTSVSAANFH